VKPQCFANARYTLVAVGIVETRADDGGLEIVVANHERDAAQVAERALVQAQECLEALIPRGLLVAVARVGERHAKHPRATPLAGLRVERRRAAEEIHLRLGAGRTVKDADGASPHREGADESLHRFVAGGVAKLLDQVLPDPLQAETRVEFLGDRRAIRRGHGSRSFSRRAGEHYGRVSIRAGEHYGRIWIVERERRLGGSRLRRCGAGEPFGRLCQASAIVSADRLAAHAGLRLDATIAPAQLEQRDNVVLLRHRQIVGYRLA
jgi:hypothetical protein